MNKMVLVLLTLTIALMGCESTMMAGMGNPASQYCIEHDGQLKITETPDGDQYGVCYFEDNRQCEEWALMRGQCPVGGVKVTGYDTNAQIDCAISGGLVDMKAETCTIDGKTCNTENYYRTRDCGDSGMLN